MAVSCIVDGCLVASPTLPNSPAPLYTPALSSSTLGKLFTYLLTQKTLLVILTNPSTPANTLIYTVFWLVGFCPYALIMYSGYNTTIDIKI
jgi:hypothetical protein